MRDVRIGVAMAAALALAGAMPAGAQEVKSATKYGDMSSVTQDVLNRAAGDSQNFLHTNGDYTQQRYYPNRQINTGNVSKLRPAWIFQTDVKESLETSPIVVNGVMYVTTSFSHVYALDARTGEELWHYAHKMGPITTFCCGPNNRGVAVADNLVYVATLDAKLLALDAKTGKVVWTTEVADPEEGYSETMAPTVVKGKVLLGTNGGEYGIRGFVKAFDSQDRQADLELQHDRRRTRSACGPKRMPPAGSCIATSRPRRRRWPRPATPTRRSAAACGRIPSVDLDTNRIYFVVGNPSPDLDGSAAPRRQSLHGLDGVARPRYRQVRLPLSIRSA